MSCSKQNQQEEMLDAQNGLSSPDNHDANSCERTDSDVETGAATTSANDDDTHENAPARIPPARTSSQSLGDKDDDHSNNNDSYRYTFRLPHERSSSMLRQQGPPHSDPGDCDHLVVVLDNYIEYSDHTKIPRLRASDVHPLRAAIQNSHWLVLCGMVIGSCFLTYGVSQYPPKLSADLAQAVVIALVLATFPEVAASSAAGAFAGMASADSIPNFAWLLLLACIVAVLWLLFHQYKILVGCGGRLGTCAFLAMNITTAVFAMPSGAVPWELYGSADGLWSERLELVPSILGVVACTFLSVLGGAVRLQSKIPLNPVQAPTTLALLCMLILEPTGFVYTKQVSEGLAVGSFVAMASENYLPTCIDFAGAGFLAGLWILFLDPFFLGFGGKKGFTSFCGFVTYVALSQGIFRRGATASKDDK